MNMYILIMVLDLIRVQYFHYLTIVWGKKATIFGTDMSSSVHIDHDKKDILILVEGLTQG